MYILYVVIMLSLIIMASKMIKMWTRTRCKIDRKRTDKIGTASKPVPDKPSGTKEAWGISPTDDLTAEYCTIFWVKNCDALRPERFEASRKPQNRSRFSASKRTVISSFSFRPEFSSNQFFFRVVSETIYCKNTGFWRITQNYRKNIIYYFLYCLFNCLLVVVGCWLFIFWGWGGQKARNVEL